MDAVLSILFVAIVLSIFAIVAAVQSADSREGFTDEYSRQALGWRIR
jgi:hypothetical protein